MICFHGWLHFQLSRNVTEAIRRCHHFIFRPSSANNDTRPLGRGRAVGLIRNKHFDIHKRTVLYIHGFGDQPYSRNLQGLAQAIYWRGDINFCALDWSAILCCNYDLTYYLNVAVPYITKVCHSINSLCLHCINESKLLVALSSFSSHHIWQNCSSNGSIAACLLRNSIWLVILWELNLVVWLPIESNLSRIVHTKFHDWPVWIQQGQVLTVYRVIVLCNLSMPQWSMPITVIHGFLA